MDMVKTGEINNKYRNGNTSNNYMQTSTVEKDAEGGMMYAAIGVILIFIGCCSNVVFLEFLVSDYPGCGNIVTFFQFLFISLEGFVFRPHFVWKPPSIPFRQYVIMVIMFFVVQVVNNIVFIFDISVPLHMIFRSGTLITNLVLGMFILKRRYKWSKHFSVILITIGIIICTLASSSYVKSHDLSGRDVALSDYIYWLSGLGLLCFTLFLSARMGIFQEMMYSEYGKHPNEALFYNHALPLPGFILLSKDIINHAVLFSQSAPVLLPVIGINIPKMWLFLAANTLTQYLCIKGVFILTSECTSLTFTLVLTLRKFVSLIFSILFFKNPFTAYHWIGAALVFGGTLLFSDIPQLLKRKATGKYKKDH